MLPGGFLGVSGSVSVLVALLPGHYLDLNFVRIRGLAIFKCKNNIIVSVRRLVKKNVWRRSVG